MIATAIKSQINLCTLYVLNYSSVKMWFDPFQFRRRFYRLQRYYKKKYHLLIKQIYLLKLIKTKRVLRYIS